MEFNLDFLRKTGEALSSFGKKDDDLIKVKDKEVVELSKDKKEDVATEAILEKSGDGSVAEEVYQKDEGVITTKDKKKESESDLEKKLANIEKVIDTFGGKPTVIPPGQLPGSNINDNINQRPLDMGQVQAKAAQAEYLKPSTVPNDRIALLYEDLKKYNLI